MLSGFRVSLCLALLSASLSTACCPSKSDSEKTEPKKDPTAGPTSANPATPTASPAPAPAGKYRKLTHAELADRVKQIMAKHKVHPEHSFGLNLKGFEGSVLATTGPEGKVFVFHLFNAEGKRTISLYDKDRNETQGNKLLAVAFEDADHDSYEDLVVLANYASGNGVSVYTRPGGGQFSFNSGLSRKAGGPASMAAALSALR